jgi:DNA-binding beta-propeller fold protein YncE
MRIRDPGMDAPPPPRQERAYRSPFDLAFSPDDTMLAVSDRTAGCLYVLDARTGDLGKTIQLRGKPSALAWTSTDTVVVCEYGAGSVAQVNARTGEIVRRFFVGPKPIGLAVAPKKGLLVVCDHGLHTVSIVDLSTGSTRPPIPCGSHPFAVAITPDEQMAIVANLLPSGPAVEHTSTALVSLIDLNAATKIVDVPLPDNSANVRGVAVSPDGRWAYVVHTRGRTMLPTTQLDRGWVNTNALSIIDLAAGSEKGRSGDGVDAWMRRSVDADDASTRARSNASTLYATVLLDTVTEGAADPWGIVLSPDGETAWISVAGAHQIAKIELGRLHTLLTPGSEKGRSGLYSSTKSRSSISLKNAGPAAPGWESITPEGGGATRPGFEGEKSNQQILPPQSGPDSPFSDPAIAKAGDAAAIWQQIQEDPAQRHQLSYHLSALYAADLMSRTPVAAKGPRAIALSRDGKQLLLASYYSGEVLVLDPSRCQVVKRLGLGPQPAPDSVRHGEFVFHDGRHSFQNWLSCASCHPDGRADGLNWDLLNDGIGTPKNARSLLWSHKTPPAMSLGVRANMEEATEKGFLFIQFREVEAGDLNAVRAYLRSMEPEPSPYLVNGQFSEKARKGKQIFEDPAVGCSACHPAPLFTSLKTYDVGTRSALDRSSEFDTPTCVELWRTSPYLHDGSAVTLKEIFTTKNPNNQHGRTSNLSPEDLDALVEYLLSL